MKRDSEPRNFPRVMIVGADSIAANSGTGITLRNLFSGWPPDRIAVVHLGNDSGESKSSTHREFGVGGAISPVDVMLRRFLRRESRSLRTNLRNSGALDLSASPGLRGQIAAHARAALDLGPIRIPRDLKEFVQRESPDVVYSLLGSSRVTRLAKEIAELADAVLVPHFMDDWITTLFTGAEFGGLARKMFLHQVNDVLSEAPFGLAISPQMATEYSLKFKKRFYTFGNLIESNDTIQRTPRDGALDIAYVGGLHLGRWKVIQGLASAIQQLEIEAMVTIHCPQSHREVSSIPADCEGVLQFGSSLAPDDVPGRLVEADILVHVESFQPDIFRYTRLSLSTKVPQYLMSGRPILALGPSGQASMQTIADSGGGIVLDSLGEDAVRGAMDLLGNVSQRNLMGDLGVEYALRNFESERSRELLRELFQQAADANVSTITEGVAGK